MIGIGLCTYWQEVREEGGQGGTICPQYPRVGVKEEVGVGSSRMHTWVDLLLPCAGADRRPGDLHRKARGCVCSCGGISPQRSG